MIIILDILESVIETQKPFLQTEYKCNYLGIKQLFKLAFKFALFNNTNILIGGFERKRLSLFSQVLLLLFCFVFFFELQASFLNIFGITVLFYFFSCFGQ